MSINSLNLFQDLTSRLLSSPIQADLQSLNTAVEDIAKTYLHATSGPCVSTSGRCWVTPLESTVSIESVIKSLKELDEKFPDQGLRAQAEHLTDLLANSQEHILVQLEDGSSVVMDRKEISFLECQTAGTIEINCREVLGIDPQLMLAILIAIGGKTAALTEIEDRSDLNIMTKSLLLFLAEKKEVVGLINEFGEERTLNILLDLTIAIVYLLLESGPVINKASLGISHSYAGASDDFFIQLLQVAQEKCFHFLEKNLQVELLSRRHRKSALKNHPLLKAIGIPFCDKNRSSTPQESNIYLLRAIKDSDQDAFNALLDKLSFQRIPFSDNDFLECIALGKRGIRRALIVAAALDKTAWVEKITVSHGNQIFLHDEDYGWFQALKRAAESNSLSSLEHILEFPKVKSFMATPSREVQNWISKILQAAAEGGHVEAMEKAIALLNRQALEQSQILDILRKAAKGGHLEAMDKAVALWNGPALNETQIFYIVGAATEGGHLEAMDKALALRNGPALQAYQVGNILGEAARGGHLEAMDKAIALLNGQAVVETQIDGMLYNAAQGGHVEAMDKALALLNGRALEKSQIAIILRVAAKGGHVEAMDKALPLLNGQALEKSQIADILRAAAERGHVEAMDKALPLLNGQALEKLHITYILCGAAKGGHVEIMDKALALWNVRVLDESEATNILTVAVQSGQLEAVDKALALLNGHSFKESQIVTIAQGAVHGGHIEAMDKALALLGRPLNEMEIYSILKSAISSKRLEMIDKALALLGDRCLDDAQVRALLTSITNWGLEAVEKLIELLPVKGAWRKHLIFTGSPIIIELCDTLEY